MAITGVHWGDLPRITAPSPSHFVERYVKPGNPVIIQGMIDDWRAFSLWTTDYLLDMVGSRRVVTQTSPTGLFGLHPERGGPRYEEREIEFRAFVEQTRSSEPRDTRLYMQRLSIPDVLPELMTDVVLPPYVKQNQVYLLNLWFGPAGNVTQLHYDMPNNFLAQIRGRKRIVLFAPSQTSRLYPYRTKAYNMSQVNIDQPDIDRYPYFSQARSVEFILEAGELLFLPSFWWHQVYSLESGISVNIWWTPLWRQLIAPQIFDNIPDIVRALRSMWARKLHARFGRILSQKGNTAHA
jgi:hypothetical protein